MIYVVWSALILIPLACSSYLNSQLRPVSKWAKAKLTEMEENDEPDYEEFLEELVEALFPVLRGVLILSVGMLIVFVLALILFFVYVL